MPPFDRSCLNPLPDNKILALTKFKALADDNFNLAQMVQCFSDRVENIVGKSRKCWFPAFSLFTTMFSKGFIFRLGKTGDCLGKG